VLQEHLIDADADTGKILQRLSGYGGSSRQEELALVETDGLFGL
jgi:hypothetical protein